MSNPLNVQRNNYHINRKDNVISTPDWLSLYIKKIVMSKYYWFHRIFDPCVGEGSLLKPWKDVEGANLIGMDINIPIDKQSYIMYIPNNFLDFTYDNDYIPDIVLMNPPFNTYEINKKWMKENKVGKALLPELFIDKVFTIWPKIPLVSIVPMGFRLNQRKKSSRWKKYSMGENKITSILSIPLDTFKGVEFHAEVLFWNMDRLDGHYWVNPEDVE